MDSEKLKPLIGKEEIASRIKKAAAEVDRDYADKDLVIVMVLKGSLCLVSDLIREIHIPFDIDVVQCSSYGQRGTERGGLQIFGLERLHIHNRDVLIVDDIFDSGHTLSALKEALLSQKPRSMKTLVLLSKNVPHVSSYVPEYVLFDIENHFVVGYGLDFKEKYRGLPGVYILDPSL